MDITTGIMRASMDMAATQLATGVQIAALKKMMEVQQDSLAMLLQSMGLGRNLNVSA